MEEDHEANDTLTSYVIKCYSCRSAQTLHVRVDSDKRGTRLSSTFPYCYGTDGVTHLTIKTNFMNHKVNHPPMV